MSASLLALRRHGLGATDASAVLGLNPWRSPLQVWSEKHGLVEDQEQSPAMRWGTLLEPVVLAEFSARTGLVIERPEIVYHHADFDELLCTPDALVLGEDSGVEAKTASAFTASEWGPDGTDEVPQHYLIQCAHCMAVTRRSRWYLAALIGGNDFRVYTIERDEKLIRDLVARERAWWQRHMVEGVQPDATALDNEGFLARRYPENDGDLIPESAEAYSLAATRKMAAEQLREAETHKAEAEARLKQLIGDHDGIRGENWSVTWKRTKDRTTVNHEAVVSELCRVIPEAAAMLPEIVRNYTTTTPGPRVFRYSERA